MVSPLAVVVTGSFASSFHGELRMTNDADVVIDVDATSNCGASST